MTQPAGWLWGLVPLALLWGAGTVLLGEPIERDVGERASLVASTIAGQVPGARAVTAQVTGRDVAISGEAMTTDGAARAMAQLRTTFGIRRASGGLSQVVAQKPYGWFASHDGKTVQLNGFVPDEATADANKAAATAALPGLRIDDRQMLAFGAPIGFAEMTKALLAELPRLAQGKVALDDLRFCIEGKAATSDAFLALTDSQAQRDRAGFQSVDCSLEPPVVAPYRWSARQTAEGGLSVEGFYPDAATRRQIADLLRNAAGDSARIDDTTKPALGAPAAFLARVTRGLTELKNLTNGRIALDGDSYVIAGEGPRDYDACQALRLRIAQMDGPDSTALATIDCPPAPPPPPPPAPAPAGMPDLPEIRPCSSRRS